VSDHIIRGLYVITAGPDGEGRDIVTQVRLAIDGGARVVQYRDKSSDPLRRLREATELVKLCRERNVPLIVNDDPELAREVGADGVHLGKEDVTIRDARALLGPNALVGVSCYDRFDRARRAELAGASYVAFGSFFPSRTKPDAVRASPELLERAKDALHIPVVAIGGISPENGRGLIEAGADALAVVEGVFGQTDILAAARRYARLFEQH